MQLLDETGSRQWQLDRVLSGEWFALPWVGPRSGEVPQAIEDALRDPADCEVIMGPASGVFAVSFFAKRGISPQRLAEIMATYGALVAAEDLETQDILICLEPDAEEAQVMAVQAWSAWLQDGTGGREAIQ